MAKEWEYCPGSEIEAASHAEAPWAATKAGKVIDYELDATRHPTGEEPLDAALAKSSKFAKYVAQRRCGNPGAIGNVCRGTLARLRSLT